MRVCAAVGHPVGPSDVMTVMLTMDDDNNGFVDFEEFASYWHGKKTNDGRREDVEDEGRRDNEVAHKKSGCNILCTKKSKDEVAKKVRRVEPESVFVVEDEGGFQSANRQALADLMASIQQTYEADFHRLEEALMMKEESRMEAHIWEKSAASCFDESDMCAQLGWRTENLQVAVKTIKRKLGDLNEDSENMEMISKYINPAFRSFCKEELAHKPLDGQAGIRGTAARVTTWDDPNNSLDDSIKDAAKAFVSSHQRDLNGIIDGETLSLDFAVQAAVNSLTEEARFRQRKITSLTKRQASMPKDTPRRIQVSGLQDESAAANGTYCVDGLRASWSRPVYVKQSGYVGDSTYYLFYDRQQTHDGEHSTHKWRDGCWVIGPTLNSNRCTAVLPEQDGQDLMTPIKDMKLPPFWESYDIVKKSWVPNAKELCPHFNVAGVRGETVQDYVSEPSAHQYNNIILYYYTMI
jgi:hypothetical protein